MNLVAISTKHFKTHRNVTYENMRGCRLLVPVSAGTLEVGKSDVKFGEWGMSPGKWSSLQEKILDYFTVLVQVNDILVSIYTM